MASKKKILVCGATGKQGGGLVEAALKEKNLFSIRACTRNPNSEKAQRLKKLGVEVVQADYDDHSSMRHALQGCYGAFLVTQWWEDFDTEHECEQAKQFAKACKDTHVQHVVWSTLDDAQVVAKRDDGAEAFKKVGKYILPSFEGKAAADIAFERLGVPTTYLLTSVYYESFPPCIANSKKKGGSYVIESYCSPNTKVPFIRAGDIGKAAFGCFKDKSTIGKRIGLVGDMLTMPEATDIFKRIFKGKEFAVDHVPYDKNASCDTSQEQAINNLWYFLERYRDHFATTRSLTTSKKLAPDLCPLAKWIEDHQEEFAID